MDDLRTTVLGTVAVWYTASVVDDQNIIEVDSRATSSDCHGSSQKTLLTPLEPTRVECAINAAECRPTARVPARSCVRVQYYLRQQQ